jgi:hypothetical protein
MTRRVEFTGWGAFRDTFAPYRAWKLLKPPVDIDGPGAKLVEVAPDDFGTREEWEGNRFRFDDDDGPIRTADDSEAADLFGGAPPSWPPEGEALISVWRTLRHLRSRDTCHFRGVLHAVTSMARHMSEATAEGPMPEPVAEGIRPEHLAYLRALVPTPVFTMPLRPRGKVRGHWAALLAHRDVAGTPIRRGDIVLHLSEEPGNPHPPGLRGFFERVPRTCLAAVADALDTDTLEVLELAQFAAWEHSVSELAASLRVTQQARWKDATSPLLIVRPRRSLVSEPVNAASDDAALFELLASVGGRMPST